jgi:hypothetical protein
MLTRGLKSSVWVIVPALMSLIASACEKNTNERANGACKQSAEPALGCGTLGSGDAAVNTGLVGYSCTGSARPDDDPKYIDGYPEGTVCVDRGTLSDGTAGYCCTSYTTDCAYNPVATCSEPSPVYGFQCRGANRPEALNPLINCGQGVVQNDYINYCCSSADHWTGLTPADTGCMLYGNQATCDNRKMGFMCAGSTLPTEEVLASNKSKADFNRMVCSTPADIPNSDLVYYCCYVPALVPEGGSCVSDTQVPNCASSYDATGVFKFGFACYGPDTPENDYPHIKCDSPGFQGKSAEGYAATLYCCEYP